jgi:hypothetical protein
MKDEITRVLFLMSQPTDDFESEVYAVFVDIKDTFDKNLVSCYATIGQHGYAHVDYIKESTEATKEQYQDLYNELTVLVGYKLEVLNKSK